MNPLPIVDGVLGSVSGATIVANRDTFCYLPPLHQRAESTHDLRRYIALLRQCATEETVLIAPTEKITKLGFHHTSANHLTDALE
jgi:hypothetical protein